MKTKKTAKKKPAAPAKKAVRPLISAAALKRFVREAPSPPKVIAPAKSAPAPASKPVTWSRGKLPGDVFIKTNSATGKHTVIDREEWETLGR